MTDTHFLYLVLDEKLGRLSESLLHLTYADDASARMQQAELDDGARHEVRLARATAAPSALVTTGPQKRLEDLGCADGEVGHVV
jgi:hypothetical protein